MHFQNLLLPPTIKNLITAVFGVIDNVVWLCYFFQSGESDYSEQLPPTTKVKTQQVLNICAIS
jgi:hypothetical protein